MQANGSAAMNTKIKYQFILPDDHFTELDSFTHGDPSQFVHTLALLRI